MQGVAPGEQEHCYWLIEPLLAAGMDLDGVRTRIVRLALDPGPRNLARLVDDQPPHVRAAWTETIERMLG
jgi:hypothetical protein